jgi:hypothetical protein
MTPVIIIAAWVCLSAPLALAIGKLISFGMREDRQDRKEVVSCRDLKTTSAFHESNKNGLPSSTE